MKLKKNYAIGLSIIFGLIVLLLCCFTLKTLINNNKSNDAKRYIANKYNIETDLISEVSYTKNILNRILYYSKILIYGSFLPDGNLITVKENLMLNI